MTATLSVPQPLCCNCCAATALQPQAAPRDALISDLAPSASRSACFGFAQSMRKWGSFVGAGLSYFLMKVREGERMCGGAGRGVGWSVCVRRLPTGCMSKRLVGKVGDR